MIQSHTEHPSSGGGSLPLQTSADPETVVENASAFPIFSTDSFGSPVITSPTNGSEASISFDLIGNPLIQRNSNLANGSIGFGADGNPQLNGAFGIPKVVGAGSGSMSSGGSIGAGGIGGSNITITGARAGDYCVAVTDVQNPGGSSGIGGLVLGCVSVSGDDTITYSLMNSDVINGYTPVGNIYILVLRFP